MENKQIFAQVTPPLALQELQEWFGRLINQALLENDKINPIAPSGLAITKEATKYIACSPTLKSHQRLQIYNQQYWWRLQEVLQTNFLLLTRLFGTHAFNKQIVTPYLCAFPPNHWSLNLLGANLPQWIQENYSRKNKQLVYESAYLDWMLSLAATRPQYAPLNHQTLTQMQPEKLIEKVFCLQPHLFLLRFEHNLLPFRDSVIKEEINFWVTQKLPEIAQDQTYYFLIFRNSKNNVSWKTLIFEEFLILQKFQSEMSIAKVCDWMEEELHEDQYHLIATHLQTWMQTWTQNGWLIFK